MDVPTTSIDAANTTFIDELPQQEAPVVRGADKARFSERAITTDMSESDWDIALMLSKPIKIYQGVWSTTDAQDTFLPIVSGNTYPSIPKDILTANISSMQTNVLKSFTFGRYNPKFTVQVNSTKFYNGRLAFGYVPNTEYSDVFHELDNITQSCQYNHLRIDAANSCPISFTIPWFSPFSSFNHTIDVPEYRTLGYVFLQVICPLQAPAAAKSAVDYTIYMALENAELHVPVNPVFTYLTPKTPPAAYGTTFARRVRFADEELNEAHGFFDSIGSIWSNIKSIASDVGSGIEHAVNLDFSEAAGDFGKALDTGIQTVEDNPEIVAMLMDKPLCLKPEVYSKHMSFANTAYLMGSDRSQRLDVTPYNMYRPNKAHFSGFHSSHDMHAAMRTWFIVQRRSWATTDAAGTSLYTVGVNPTYINELDHYGFMNYISQAFQFWTGDIEFKVSVVATQFHTGRLLISNSPGCYKSMSIDEAVNSPMAVMDLSNTENREVTFTCKYNSVYPYLFTRFTADTKDLNEMLSFQGIFNIYVQNQLEAPESVASSVVVLIEARVGENFRLWQPRDPTYVPYLGENPSFASITIPSTGAITPTSLPVTTKAATSVSISGDVAVVNGSKPFDTGILGTVPVVNGSAQLEVLPYNTESGKLLEVQCFNPGSTPTEKGVPLYVTTTARTELNEAHMETPTYDKILKAEALVSEMSRTVARTMKIVGEAAQHLRDSELRDPDSVFRVGHKIGAVELILQKTKRTIDCATNDLEYLKTRFIPPPVPREIDLSRLDLNEAHMDTDTVAQPQVPSDQQVHLATTPEVIEHPISHSAFSTTNDFRDLARRYGFLSQLSITKPTTSSSITIYFPVTPVGPTVTQNLLSYIANIHRGWSGSLRYKILFDANNISQFQFYATHYPDMFLPGGAPVVRYTSPGGVSKGVNGSFQGAGYACKQATLVNEKGIEIEIPFITNRHFLFTRRIFGDDQSNQADCAGCIALTITFPDPAVAYVPKLNGVVYISAGDDFNFHYLIPPQPVSETPATWSSIVAAETPPT